MAAWKPVFTALHTPLGCMQLPPRPASKSLSTMNRTNVDEGINFHPVSTTSTDINETFSYFAVDLLESWSLTPYSTWFVSGVRTSRLVFVSVTLTLCSLPDSRRRRCEIKNRFTYWTDNSSHALYWDVTVVLVPMIEVWRVEEAEKERNACSELHLMSCICNVGTSVSVQPCVRAPVRSVCYPAFLHATAPQDMAICHQLGPLINAAPASHDSSQCMHTYAHSHSSSDRWVKRWATSCVKWTEGRGVLAIMVKQTAWRDRHVYMCVYNKEGAHGHVQKYKQSINQNNPAL